MVEMVEMAEKGRDQSLIMPAAKSFGKEKYST
jgi:hypothetical protein